MQRLLKAFFCKRYFALIVPMTLTYHRHGTRQPDYRVRDAGRYRNIIDAIAQIERCLIPSIELE